MDTFATAITCIDGRVQQPIADWVKLHLNVRYVDLVTEPGSDKALAQAGAEIITEVLRKIWVSITYHNSSIVVLAGHDACAADPVSKEEHIEQIIEGVKVLAACKLPARIVGLWVNEWGSVDLICDTKERELVTSHL